MNLSVIVFPPANPCPSSLHVRLSSLGSDTMGSAPAKVVSTSAVQSAAGQGVHSWSLAGSLPSPEVTVGTREQWPGLRWSCPAALLSRSCTAEMEGNLASSYHAEHTQAWIWPSRGAGGGVWWDCQTLCDLAEQTPAGLLGWAVRCCHNAGSSFNTENPKIEDGSQKRGLTFWFHHLNSPI